MIAKDELERMCKESSCHIFHMCEGIKENHETLTQDSQSLGQDLNSEHSEHKVGMLPSNCYNLLRTYDFLNLINILILSVSAFLHPKNGLFPFNIFDQNSIFCWQLVKNNAQLVMSKLQSLWDFNSLP
jgi:hypothetical protein